MPPPGSIPDRFGEEFLAWFREATERAWKDYEPQTFEDHVAANVGGLDWRRDTKWSPFSEAEIAAVERAWGAPLPPDYRFFLEQLGATEPRMTGALFVGPEGALKEVSRPGFYDWRSDEEAMRGALDNVFEGLAFDVERNNLWDEAWGAKPASVDGRRERLRKAVDAAPRLIPIYMHRFLLAEPLQSGNPVLSIHQSDIIVYGTDLRNYLLNEFERLLGVKIRQHPEGFDPAHIRFWGEFER